MMFAFGCIVGCGLGGLAILMICLRWMQGSMKKSLQDNSKTVDLLIEGNQLREARNIQLERIADILKEK